MAPSAVDSASILNGLSSTASLKNWSSAGIPSFDFDADESTVLTEDFFGSSPCQTSTRVEATSDVQLPLTVVEGQEKHFYPNFQTNVIVHSDGHGWGTPNYNDELENDALIDTYYARLHNAHPFVAPRKLTRLNRTLLPPQLKSVMRFAASHFTSGRPQDNLQKAAESVTSELFPSSGFKVQGLMLFGISLFAKGEQGRAVDIFDRAIDLALDLGMNTDSFSTSHGMGNPIIEESWRRTWWDLYMIDGILASLNSIHHPFRLQNVQNDVLLPCEEYDYAQCNPISPPRSQCDFSERNFAAETYDYSSMAYKIEAVRLMGNVLATGKDDFATSNEQVEALDASLANFILSLPSNKRHIVERDGKVDEVLFSAHNIIDCALIMLHRPRSDLTIIRNHYPTPCTREEAVRLPLSVHEIHTSKAINAANSISTATALRVPLAAHSPCFICVISLAAVVHLPAYAMENSGDRASAIKERLQLTVSALNSIGEVWHSAKIAKSQLSQFTREVFALAKEFKQVEAQPQQTDIESLMDDRSWLDDLSLLRDGATALS